MSGFLRALPVVLEYEGGFTVDTGGPTYQGVTQDSYDAYRKRHGKPLRDVREMEGEERDHLYYDGYWVAAKCDKLPWPLSFVHFDHAVNAGVSQAIKTLQIAIEAKPDGVWGPKTQERLGLSSHNEHILMDAMLFARLAHYHHLALTHPKPYGKYLNGWLGRVLKLRKKALEMW